MIGRNLIGLPGNDPIATHRGDERQEDGEQAKAKEADDERKPRADVDVVHLGCGCGTPSTLAETWVGCAHLQGRSEI